MKKILFVIYSMKYGGAERSLANLLQTLPEDKYQADLLLFQKTGDFLEQLPGWVNVLETPEDIEQLYAPVRKTKLKAWVKIVGTGLSRLAKKSVKERAAWRWKNVYGRKIRGLEKEYDVAVAYAGSENLYFIRDKVKARRKIVWVHNDYRTAGYSKADDAPYFDDMDAIVSVSAECVEVLRQEFPQHSGKIHCIENITSASSVRKQSELFFPEEYDKNRYNILSVGRMHPQKGFDMAVEAASILKKQGCCFHWYLIGDGPLRSRLEQKIEQFDVADCFSLLGTRLNPYAYIKNSALLVQSSLYEGKSIVLDEAKMLCTPIVATAYPTVRDQVKDGDEGLITELSSEGIAEGIQRLMEDRKTYEHIKNYLAAHDYGNEAECEKYMELLDSD